MSFILWEHVDKLADSQHVLPHIITSAIEHPAILVYLKLLEKNSNHTIQFY